MQIFNELNENKGLSLAFGFFDGVHIGHKSVIKSAVDFARENNTKSAVITFQDHPCCYFYEVKPKYIIKKHDKFKFFEDLGVDYLYSLKFDDYIAMMSASEYLNDVIIKYFAPSAISTGFNHYFGSKKTGDVNFLCTMQHEFCYKYFEVPPVLLQGEIVSSTRVRNDLAIGNMEIVNELLGYNYFLEETVVKGQQLGRQLGFKTANLIYPEDLVEPASGVYKVQVEYEGKIYNGIANYGLRPTVNIVDDNDLSGKYARPTMVDKVGRAHQPNNINLETKVLEVHIFDFDKEIYGEKIKVTFLKKIRDEKRFSSLDELKSQIETDILDSKK